MLDRQQHELMLKNILRDIYKDPYLSQRLVFKGGTACYLFYSLPRFSVDLDFNSQIELDQDSKKIILEKIGKIANQYGGVQEQREKKNTLLVVLRYMKNYYPVKVGVSLRQVSAEFELLNLFGLGVAVLPREMIFAEKLQALTNRRGAANRDVFDVNFFFQQGWRINRVHLEQLVGKNWAEYLKDCIKFVDKKVKIKTILDGLGQLLNQTQRKWVKENLKEEVLWQLKSYLGTQVKV